VLDLIITHSNSITFTDLKQLQLQRLQRERTAPLTREKVIAAQAFDPRKLRRGEVTAAVARDR
jgi:hypothetical protein